MNESELAIALEPFRRVPGAKAVEGTGLGLPLTKALVEANHADFTIKSRKDQGTLVEIAFPAKRLGPRNKAPSDVNPRLSRRRGRRFAAVRRLSRRQSRRRDGGGRIVTCSPRNSRAVAATQSSPRARLDLDAADEQPVRPKLVSIRYARRPSARKSR